MKNVTNKEREKYYKALKAVYDVFNEKGFSKNVSYIKKEFNPFYQFKGFCEYLKHIERIGRIDSDTRKTFLKYLINYPPKGQILLHEISYDNEILIKNFLFEKGDYQARKKWLLSEINKLKRIIEKEKEKQVCVLMSVYLQFTPEVFKKNIELIRKELYEEYFFTGFCSYLEHLENLDIIKSETHKAFLEYLVDNSPKSVVPPYIRFKNKMVYICAFLFPEANEEVRREWLLKQIKKLLD